MLVHGLDFATRHRQERKMKSAANGAASRQRVVSGNCACHSFSATAASGGRASGFIGEKEAFERQGQGPQGFGELERQRAAGKNFARGIARRSGVGGGKEQFHFVQRTLRIPQGAARPSAMTSRRSCQVRSQRAPRADKPPGKIRATRGIVGGAVQFHGGGRVISDS